MAAGKCQLLEWRWELTVRMTLQDDNGEEGDVQKDRRGWI